jgi:queuosine precursor transporter
MSTPTDPTPTRWRPFVAAAVLVATVVVANWVTTRYGLIPAGFGLQVTAGTYAAGLALAARDVLHEAGGVRWVLATIAVGAVLSLVLADGRIALASAAAFLLAELLDLAVYAPLRRRHWPMAVAASNAVGAVVDTLVFLTVAGFQLTAGLVAGQVLVKAVWVTCAFLAVAFAARAVFRRPVTA